MATPDQLKAMQALEKRGKLPDSMRPAYNDAVKNGLIKETGPRAKAAPAPPLSAGEQATDFAKSVGSGIVRGVEGIPGSPGDVQQLTGVASDALRSKLGMAEKPGEEPSFLSQVLFGNPRVGQGRLPNTEDVDAVVREHVGDFNYTPKTTLGRYGKVGGEFLPNIVGGPGRLATRAVTRVALPAIGSETAGRLTEGTAYEPYARVVGAVAGAGTGHLASRAVTASTQPGGPLAAVSRGSANYAANAAPSAEQLAELQRLGPEAMLADVSPEWYGVSRGAASRPGSRDAIVNALIERQRRSNQRLGQDLDTSLGSVRNPTTVEQHLLDSRRALGPEYDRALIGAHAVDTQPIADALDAQIINSRGAAQAALRAVRDDLNIPGQNVLDPHPQALLASRNALDGLMGDVKDTNVLRNLQAARRLIDAELTRAVPGIKDIDAQYHELHRQSEGLTRGGQVLDSGKEAIRPEDLAAEMQAGAQPHGTMVGPSGVPAQMRTGARAEIDRIAGTNANDAVALQRMVKGEGDWNRDKLRTLFGPQADDALNAIDRESLFNQTRNTVVGGSPTAMTNQFGEFLNRAAKPPTMPLETTLPGLVAHYGQRGMRKLLGTNAEARAQRYADELGRASVARGADRDALIAAIQDYARRRAHGPTAAGQNMARAALISALLEERRRSSGQ
jgi:hypothetical protein